MAVVSSIDSNACMQMARPSVYEYLLINEAKKQQKKWSGYGLTSLTGCSAPEFDNNINLIMFALNAYHL
jgi:hypothetical protein